MTRSPARHCDDIVALIDQALAECELAPSPLPCPAPQPAYWQSPLHGGTTNEFMARHGLKPLRKEKSR